MWFPLHFHLNQYTDISPVPCISSPWNGSSVSLKVITRCTGKKGSCVIVQAEWPYDRHQLNCSAFNIIRQSSKYLHTWINWALSLCRLDTGDWEVISMDVLPVTVILEVLILMCKSGKWMTILCDNIPHSHIHIKAHFFYMLIVKGEGVYFMTSKGNWKAMTSRQELEPSWLILLEIFSRLRWQFYCLGLPWEGGIDACKHVIWSALNTNFFHPVKRNPKVSFSWF